MKDYDRLLCGGIWCILQMEYEFIEEDKKNTQPIRIRKLTPIQMPHIDMDEVKMEERHLPKKSGWIFCFVPLVWSRIVSAREQSGY